MFSQNYQKNIKLILFFLLKDTRELVLDPTPFIKNSRIFRIPENAIGRSIWLRESTLEIMRGGFNKYARDSRKLYRLVTPRKVEIFHAIWHFH